MGSARSCWLGASSLSKRPLVPYSLFASSNPLFHPPHSPSGRRCSDGCRRVAATTSISIGALFPASPCYIRVRVSGSAYCRQPWSLSRHAHHIMLTVLVLYFRTHGCSQIQL